MASRISVRHSAVVRSDKSGRSTAAYTQQILMLDVSVPGWQVLHANSAFLYQAGK
jgi:hypothetical protein